MLVSEQDILKQDIAAWVKHYGKDRCYLIPILQHLERKYSQISEFAMQVVADELDIHPVEVFSVVSFYSFLDHRPHGKFVIRLCRTISCDMVGKDQVANQLVTDLGIDFGETTLDGKFTLEWTNCLGLCDQGPAMLVNEAIYAQVTPEAAHDIIEACRKTFGVYALQTKEGHA